MMKLPCLALIAFCSSILSIVSLAHKVNDPVIALTQQSFQDTLKDHETTMVQFYTPWCGFCKTLSPELTEAALQLAAHNITIFKVNCDQEEDLCAANHIKGYPTLKIFREGDFHSDFDERTVPAIVSHLKRLNLPPIQKLERLEDVNRFMNSSDISLLGFFNNKTTKEAAVFEALARKYREKAEFGRTNLSEAFVETDVKAPAVVAYKNYDEKRVVYTGEFTMDALRRFLFVERLERLGTVNVDTYGRYIEAELPMVYIFYILEEDRARLSRELMPIALRYKNNVTICFIDGFEHGPHAQILGISEEKFPAVSIHHIKENLKYPLSQNTSVTSATLESHIMSVLSGKAKAQFNSAPIPEVNDGPVKTVVHDNFADIVLDQSKDVLLELFAPWCRECKQLAPIYEKLGESYLPHNDTIVIARMDIDHDKNDLPRGIRMEFRTIPSFFFFPAGEGTKTNPIKFNGNYSMEDFDHFISMHATY